MVEHRNTRGRLHMLSAVRHTDETDRATTFELFFDLVYVFAAIQITGYIFRTHSALGVVQGMLLLALLWWTWTGYTWLGNHARADEGLVRTAMAVATAAVFVVAVTIPEAWRDAPGGLHGPLVLVCAFLLVRCLHLTVYSIAAGGDPSLRRQIAVSWIPTAAGAVLLVAGVLLGGAAQTLLFSAALVVDWGGVYLTSLRGGWRVQSAGHWTERHGLFVLLAIGESVVAMGVGAAEQTVGAPLILACVLGIAAVLCLWWLYFDGIAVAAEERMAAAPGQARAKMAIEGYTYGHFVLVAGVILAAVGVEGVIANADETERLDGFYAVALFGGFAVYLAGHLLFSNRLRLPVSRARVVTTVLLLAVTPLAAYAPPLAALAGLLAILVALIAVETRRYSHQRNEDRNAPAP
ncbi:low temperature requirement protein A [Modestobacter sp. KNN46-3]|jgi:low temperature requirement protein LtrA|uniref:low temperature requirement protein A n=1 Tax=Modestobacter sp. KNN46-3 TaxID=2711218 RepID=UPI0013DE825C|nr:low temperature requirement protein A [Modestobacter sp. KNN46-3]